MRSSRGSRQPASSRQPPPQQQQRRPGPRLQLDESSDDSEVDSDVERLAAESIDRRRQATIAAAVAEAESALRAAHEKELTTCKEQLLAELDKAEARREASDVAAARLRKELESAREEGVRTAREEGQRLEGEQSALRAEVEKATAAKDRADVQLDELGRRCATAEERLRSTEAERVELERARAAADHTPRPPPPPSVRSVRCARH